MRSLYERIGGDPAIAAVVDGLYVRLVEDPRVLHFFDDDRLPSLKDAQRRWFRSVLGGAPADDRPDLAAAHAHLVITDEQVAVVLGHLDGAMSDAGVGDDLRRQVLSLVGRLWLARVF